MNEIFLETRMFWLSDGEEIMTLAFFFLIQYRSVTDRRTDRQTERQTDIPPLAIPAVCIARYANALVKIKFKHFHRPSYKDLRTFKDHVCFKDFPCLENLENKFKDFQGPARALTVTRQWK